MTTVHALFRCAAVALLATLTACGGGGGGSATPPPPPTLPPPSGGNQPYNDPTIYSTAATASLASAVEAAAITKHQITLRGTTYNYTATTGHLTASHPVTNAPEASFFYVAYTLDNQPAATRPVTFFYNGGPGSAAVWLHMGSFAPKRLQVGFPATTQAAPFPLVDNAETLLDTSDLVFVDAVGTGYSQAIEPNTNQSFWGVDGDARVFRDFIVRYLGVNNRTASPKFLFGESYGTTRSAVLVHLLETAGVSMKGVVLQSSVLNYNTNCDQVSFNMSCGGFLPSYAATGAWFNRTTPAQTDMVAYMQQMRDYTENVYEPALTQLFVGTPPSSTVLAQLQNLTGISAATWQNSFNLRPFAFQQRLLPAQLLGRYDARVVAPLGSALASEGDPSSTFISRPFSTAIASYLVNGLQYGNASTYVLLSNAIATWNFSHDGNPLPDVIPDLAAAFALNPNLKVIAVNGYHDLATPFRQTERDLARLGANPNISIRSYLGGHMTYLDDTSRPLQRADLEAFYRSALAQ